MRNSFKLFVFSVLFSITTVTAQAANLSPELPDETPASKSKETIFNDKEFLIDELPLVPGSSLEQPSVPKQMQPDIQKIKEPAEQIQSKKKKSEKKKPKKQKRHTAAIPAAVPQKASSDTKTAVENSDSKRVEKWLEEKEASEKKSPVKKNREPVKKPMQTFSISVSPEPAEDKTGSKQPEKKSNLNLNFPVKPPMPLPAKTLKPPLAPEMSNEKKRAEDTKKFQSDLKSAESGNAEAQLSVGIKLYKGQGVLQDRKNGFLWILKAAEDGKSSPESLNILGQAYFKGIDIDKNYVEARRWLGLTADQDNYSAKNDLAYMLFNGLGGDKDYAKAFELYQQAAKHGDVFAQANLGLMYATGTGTEIDKVRAYAWYSFAASQGNIAAATNRNDLLKDMSWDEINLAQRISVELYHEVENPSVNKGQLEQTNLQSRPLNSEQP